MNRATTFSAPFSPEEHFQFDFGLAVGTLSFEWIVKRIDAIHPIDVCDVFPYLNACMEMLW